MKNELKPMSKSNQNQWNSMKIHENEWCSLKIIEDSWKINENLSKSMKHQWWFLFLDIFWFSVEVVATGDCALALIIPTRDPLRYYAYLPQVRQGKSYERHQYLIDLGIDFLSPFWYPTGLSRAGGVTRIAKNVDRFLVECWSIVSWSLKPNFHRRFIHASSTFSIDFSSSWIRFSIARMP